MDALLIIIDLPVNEIIREAVREFQTYSGLKN